MRVLVLHGYLLRGTGSNIYNARLCAALARAGHDVHLVCQERAPEDVEGVVAAGDWDGGALRIRRLREGPGVTAYRPDIGGLLPVYVADRYEGVEARPFAACSDAEVEDYVARNVAAVREVAARAAPDVALANHLVMQPAILARALAGTVPYAVKVHGSALEYTVKPEPERFLPWAREGLAGAATVLVGSRHTAESLWAALGDPGLPARMRLGPPGVDVEQFAPGPRTQAAAELAALADRLAAAPRTARTASAFTRDPMAAAAALRSLDGERDRHVAFVGKLIVSKGVDLLAVAWPLVLAQVPRARLVVVGFGAYREALERLIAALGTGDLAAVRALARAGREPEGGPRAPLRYVLAFLDDLERSGTAEYRAAAARLPERIVLCGRLEHDELPPLLRLSEALLVPSTFPEAFGMVAAEAAACAALPISAHHSGLAEVAATLAPALPPAVRDWLTFPLSGEPVRALADRVLAWLHAEDDVRARVRGALVATARERYSWDGVGRDVIAAALGRHDELPEAPRPAEA